MVRFMDSRSQSCKTVKHHRIKRRMCTFTKPKTLKEEIMEVGLPGFSRLAGPNLSKHKRGFWVLLCLFIVGSCFYQCGDRIHFYFSGPPSIYTEFVRNKTIIFPSLTICPTNIQGRNPVVWPELLKGSMFGNVSYTDIFDLVNKTKMDVATLWNISRIDVHNLTFALSQGTTLIDGYYKRKEDVKLLLTPTTAGICLTFKPKKEIPHRGRYTFLSVKSEISSPVNKEMMLRYMAHLEEDTPLVRYTVPLEGVHGIFMAEMHTAYRIEETRWLNTWLQPCSSGDIVSRCKTRCLQKLILSKANRPKDCRLPYMQEDMDNIPECETHEEFMDVFKATHDVLIDFDETDCSCGRKCRDISYPVEIIAERPSTSNTSLFMLVAYIPENRIQLIQEQSVYNSVALFSDIGGGMGLFLGICTFHLVEIIDIIITRLIRKYSCCYR